METSELSQRVAAILGVEEMTESEQKIFMERTIPIIIESSLNRLLVTFEEAEIPKLEAYLDNDPKAEEILEHLLDTYPQFEAILQEEVIAFQTEVVEVME
jgi:hypothetical protein